MRAQNYGQGFSLSMAKDLLFLRAQTRRLSSYRVIDSAILSNENIGISSPQ